ncbi:MAG: hypothetical protein ACI959_001759 [Limisphaerales bacterium]|jgi:hypothetical protein
MIRAMKRIILIYPLLTLLFFSAEAQENSPFSRFGIGDILSQEFSVSQGMGGLSTGLFEADVLNISNPASYAFLTRATLDIGIYGNVLTISNDEESLTSGNASISHLAVGLPIWKRRMGLSFGLVPFSRTQYNIQQTFEPDTSIGRQVYDFQGGGTTYRIYLGLGHQYKGFSVGANASYMFGRIFQTRIITFPDEDEAYSTRAITANTLGGFVFDAGLGYRYKFRNDLSLNLGLSGKLKSNLGGSEDTEWSTLIVSENFQFVKDSISFIDNGENDITLPTQWSAGFTLKQGPRNIDDPLWTFGVDFSSARFSQFEGFSSFDTVFTDSWKVKVGGEFTPARDPESTRRRIDYRLGFQYGKSHLQFNSEPLNEFGITFGFGIPISGGRKAVWQRSSKINMSFQVGQRGSDLLFNETFYRGTIGFTLSDSRWFLKSKIN